MNNKNSTGKTRTRIVAGKYLLGIVSVLLCVLVISSLTLNVLAEEVSGSQTEPATTSLSGESVEPEQEPSQESYTVTFTYGESMVFGEVQTVAAGGYVTAPDTVPPAPEGKEFTAWYAEGASEPFDFASTPITADTTLVAGWQDAQVMTPFDAGEENEEPEEDEEEIEMVTVTLMVDGAVYDEIEVIKNTLVTLPVLENASDGTPFLGWFAEGETAPFASTRLVENNITLVARYSENLLVTFVDSTGIVLQTVEVASGESLSDNGFASATDLPAPTVPTGQEFLYWVKQGETSAFDVTAPVTGHITLVPRLKEQALAVFITYGSEVDPQTGPEGFSPNRPAAPTRTGYTFAGWYTEPNGGGSAVYFANDTSPAGTPIAITGTVFIYAKWAPKTVQYTVNVWVEKKDIENPGDPLVDGTGDYEVQYTTTKTAQADSEVTYTEAQARALTNALASGTYARNLVTYSDFKVSEKKSISANGDTVINVFFTRMVFTFTFDPRYNSVTFSTIVFPDVELSTDNGPVAIPYVMKAKVEQTVAWPSAVNLNKSGNYFTNWSGYYGLRAIAPVSFTDISVAMSSANNTVTATATTIAEPKQRSITLYAGSHTAPFTEQRQYYVEMTEAEKQAYLDNGGAATHGSTGTLPNGTKVRVWQAEGPSAYSGTVRFYKFDCSGATSYQSADPGTSYTGWPGKAISGFEQVGAKNDYLNYKYITTQYYVESEIIGKNEVNKNSYYLYYYMPRKSYTVTLVANGGSIANLPSEYDSSTLKASVVYEGSIPLPGDSDVTRDRFVFEGWYTDEGMTEEFDRSTTMPTKDLTLFAKWRGTAITVRYRDGGASDVAVHTYDDNQVLLAHDLGGTPYEHAVSGETVIEGKGVFQGWYYTVGAGETQASIEFPLGINLTRTEYILTARFTDVTYNVTFKGNEDGTPVEYGVINNISTGKTLAQSGHSTLRPTRTAYTLLGWSTEEAATRVNFTAANVITKDTTVYAVWRVNNFDVTYNAGARPNADGMPDPLITSVTALTTFTVAAGPTIEGYTFTGWKSSADNQTYKVGGTATFTMPTQNVTLTAQWQVNTHNVTYDAGTQAGATDMPASHTQNYGTVVNVAADPSATGHTFTGWLASGGAAGTYRQSGLDSFVMPDGDVTLTAQWDINSYNVIYADGKPIGAPTNVEDMPGQTTQSYNYQAGVTVEDEPSLTGYTFAGWRASGQLAGTYDAGQSFNMPAGAVTLTATWTINDYDVTYADGKPAGAPVNVADMPSQTTQSYEYQEEVTVEGEPTLTGYTFTGWLASVGLTGTHDAGGTFNMPAGNVTLTAQWSIDSYEVKYLPGVPAGAVQNMPSPAVSSKEYNSEVSVSTTVPTAQGYRFTGWRTSQNNTFYPTGTPASFTMPAQNVTLTAEWVETSVVTFKPNNGGTNFTSTVDTGAPVSAPAQPTAPNAAAFLGWYTASDALWSFSSNVAGDMTLTAKWQHTVAFDLNGGVAGALATPTEYDTQAIVRGNVASQPGEDPTRVGYTFKGWSVSGAETNLWNFGTGVNANLTLKAVWARNNYTVTYNAGSGAQGVSGIPASAQTYAYEASVRTATPTSVSHNFAGWQGSDGNTYTAGQQFAMPAENLVLTAQWTIKVYTVVFDLDGGAAPTGTPGAPYANQSINHGDQASEPTVSPEKTGFTFGGWYSGSTAWNFSSGVTGNLTLKAKWNRNTYTITYDAGTQTGANGMPNPLQKGYLYQNSVTAASAPTATTYDFAGWLGSDGNTYAAGQKFNMPAENLTLTAQWEIKKYTVSFDAGWGLSVAPITGVEHGSTVNAPGMTSFEGGMLAGWYKDAECTQKWDFGSDVVTKNVTLYAKWNLYTYTVTFDSRGGSYVAPFTDVPYGSRIVPPQAPLMDGYAYRGWFLGADLKVWWRFDTDIVKGNITLYARWEVPDDTFIVEFSGNGADVGANPGSMEADKGEALGSLPTAPSRTGYLFAGWNTSPDGSGSSFYADTTVNSDMVVYAQWLKTNLLLRFDLNGAQGTAPATQTLTEGDLAQAVGSPEREGYTFLGWNTSPDGSGSGWDFGSTQMPGYDVTLYAQWGGEDSSSSTSGLPASGNDTGDAGDMDGGEDAMSTIHLGSGQVPLVGNHHWALANLILTVAGILTALFALVLYFVRRRKNEEAAQEDAEDGTARKTGTKRLWTRIVSAVLAMASTVVFLLTENMKLDMAITDNWTLLMVILFIGVVVLALLGRRKRDEEDEEEAGHTGRIAYDK